MSKVPVLKINANGPNDFKILAKDPKVIGLINERLVEAIGEGMKSKKKEIPIYKLSSHESYFVIIKQEQWKPSLSKALESYVEKEDWDMCIKCRDLINQL
jgi:hypothetical protein